MNKVESLFFLTSSVIRLRNIMENLSGLAYLVYLLHPIQLALVQGSRGFPH